MTRNDNRDAIYTDLHQGQLTRQEAETRYAAGQVITMLREYVAPKSLLDIGCGLGIWLKVALDMGIENVLGVEGPWIDGSTLAVPTELIRRHDLEQPISLGRRFDVVVCSEVGEHLPASAAANLIDLLVAHGDHILFSAAIPFQGGHHHVNEQFLGYWIEQFARHDFVVLDVFRQRLWDDKSILWWLRQNLVLFVKRSVAEANPALSKQMEVQRPVSIVHPNVYLQRVQRAQRMLKEHGQLMAVLRQCGKFEVKKEGDGRITISRLG